MDDEPFFNPLDKLNLGRSIVEALLESREEPLGAVQPFRGAGIYAIYYRGPFKPYAPLADLNRKRQAWPIYVGKAVPRGGRKGISVDMTRASDALHKRLQDHAGSVQAVSSLDLKGFSFRRLVVDDIWIALGEALVIERFRPLWNTVVEGFGNHNPGSGRFKGRRPLWDELHPGRPWATKCKQPKLVRSEILEEVTDYMKTLPSV